MSQNLITAIVPSPRRPGRFSLSIDGQHCAVLSLESIERLRLAVGGSVVGKEQEIEREAIVVKVYDRALNMLALRARSSRELARSLVQKGEEQAHVDRAIEKLTEQGLLDDAAFAESFTRSKALGARQSKRRVQQGLAKKGVARDVSDAAIATVFEEEGVDQRGLVLDAARKKLRSLTKVEPLVRRRRLYAFLARRGYELDDIRAALATLAIPTTPDD
jgi:regulatory protein